MAIRVRKLAKRLGKRPAEVLGILHALGIERYRSPEDMLSGMMEQKIIRGFKDGVHPVPLAPMEVKSRPERVAVVEKQGVFDGVVRQKADPRFESLPSPAAPAAARASQPATPVPVTAPVSSGAQALLRAEREAFDAAREALVAEREALAAAREALAAEREALEIVRSRPTVDSTTLSDVLSRRGLLGNDEYERAIRALAEERRISEVLPYLTVSDPRGLESYLRNILLLVDGRPPEGLTGALVAVARERAEVPGSAEWRRLTSKLSEALLLNGARRVLVVGGPVRIHRLLANALDPRIEIRFRPTRKVVSTDAAADVSRTDAVALWNIDVDVESEAIYGGGRVVVSVVSRADVRSLLETWIRDLSEA